MADQTDLAQVIAELAADGGDTELAQVIAELAAEGGDARLAQVYFELAASLGDVRISQVTIELARGPEVIPPASNPVNTFTVGAGLGNTWDLALQLSDSGVELRDKVVKSLRATGKFTNGKMKVYGYGPEEDVVIDDIEDGTNSKVMVLLDDSTHVQQSRRHQVNVKNAMMHTVRIEGNWPGTGIPDRIDEIVYEVAGQGIRR